MTCTKAHHWIQSWASFIHLWYWQPISPVPLYCYLLTSSEQSPLLFEGVRFQEHPHPPPKAKSKSLQINQHPQNKVLLLLAFFSCLFIINEGLLLLSVQLLEHHVVWLKDLFKLSKNSDAPKYWRVQRRYFYSWCKPANLQNREAQTRNKCVGPLTRGSWALLHPGDRDSQAVFCSPENGRLTFERWVATVKEQ